MLNIILPIILLITNDLETFPLTVKVVNAFTNEPIEGIVVELVSLESNLMLGRVSNSAGWADFTTPLSMHATTWLDIKTNLVSPSLQAKIPNAELYEIRFNDFQKPSRFYPRKVVFRLPDPFSITENVIPYDDNFLKFFEEVCRNSGDSRGDDRRTLQKWMKPPSTIYIYTGYYNKHTKPTDSQIALTKKIIKEEVSKLWDKMANVSIVETNYWYDYLVGDIILIAFSPEIIVSGKTILGLHSELMSVDVIFGGYVDANSTLPNDLLKQVLIQEISQVLGFRNDSSSIKSIFNPSLPLPDTMTETDIKMGKILYGINNRRPGNTPQDNDLNINYVP
jgi:hypothetical protein